MKVEYLLCEVCGPDKCLWWGPHHERCWLANHKLYHRHAFHGQKIPVYLQNPLLCNNKNTIIEISKNDCKMLRKQ